MSYRLHWVALLAATLGGCAAHTQSPQVINEPANSSLSTEATKPVKPAPMMAPINVMVPVAVRATILKESAGGMIVGLEREMGHGQMEFEARAIIGRFPYTIRVAGSGLLLSKSLFNPMEEGHGGMAHDGGGMPWHGHGPGPDGWHGERGGPPPQMSHRHGDKDGDSDEDNDHPRKHSGADEDKGGAHHKHGSDNGDDSDDQ